MTKKNLGLNTSCIHIGEVADEQFKGAVSPLFMSSSYAFQDVDTLRYPRAFNTPNQEGMGKKIAALEHAEAGLVFGSGMAAVSTSLLAFLQKGDHAVLTNAIYGGTFSLARDEFEKFGIEYDFAEDVSVEAFAAKIKPNTKVIYIETPSNPLLKITDLKAIADLAKAHNLVSMIDNTFASPVNQNPIDFGIDVVIHSATKYLGGHSDILAGAVAASNEHIDRIKHFGKNMGGNLSDYTVWLLERSIKTLGVRIKAHNANAQLMAEFLKNHSAVDNVYYPGLPSHPNHKLAASQMKGFGGMLSFELKQEDKALDFQKALQLIKPSMSLAGVESTILSPFLTSHGRMTKEERLSHGIKDGLIRFSVGIEDADDLINDLEQAFDSIKK